jgi:hypothetical protein
MIDPFVLLTPILMLGVLALVRFVGCNQIFGLDPTAGRPAPPTNLVAIPGDARVDLRWDYENGDATDFQIWYHEDMGGPYQLYPNPQIVIQVSQGAQHGSAPVANLLNGTKYFFNVTATIASSHSSLTDSHEVSAIPGVTDFLTPNVLGGLRTDFTGWVGMAIQVASSAVTVTQLGRIVATANAQPHVVKILDLTQNNLEIASAIVSLPGGPVGTFTYQPLAQPVTLEPFKLYYILTHEVVGGDFFHDASSVTPTGVAAILSAVFNDDATPTVFTTLGTANVSYGVVNFRY